MSIYPYYSDYSKQAAQLRPNQSLDYNPNAFQWLPTDQINQNKQTNAREIETVGSCAAEMRELPKFGQQEMLSWYQTVPLRHDSFPQEFDTNGTIQDFQLNRKGKK